MSDNKTYITLELAQTLFDLYEGQEEDNFEVIEIGTWEQDYKYQNNYCIIKDLSSDSYYRFTVQRSGSPFSDWYYEWGVEGRDYSSSPNDSIQLEEVEMVVISTYEWRRKGTTIKND